MSRRDALQRLGLLVGGALSAPLASGLLGGCRPHAREAVWRPQVVDEGQYATLRAAADTIIPATDTPGAVDAGVPEFIDELLAGWYSDAERQRFVDGLVRLDADARAAHGAAFADLAPADRAALLTPLDAEAVAAREAGVAPEERPFFGMLKEMTLVGYYASEIGMTEELRWDPIPGQYRPCVPLADVGRAWAPN